MTPPRLPICVLAAALLALAGCAGGGGSSSNSEAQKTFEAIREQAEQTPVDEPLRQYASDLCGPIRDVYADASDILASFDEVTPDVENFEEAFDALGQLADPFAKFRDDVKEIDPPDELADYHEAFVRELDYAVQTVEALSEGGLAAALTLPTAEVPTDEPPGFQAAIIQECGGELAQFVDELGGDFLSDEIATPEG